MKPFLRNHWLQFGLRLIIGVVFINAGLMKVRNPLAFADNVEAFHLLPLSAVTAVAQGLPWLEMICGALLIGGWHKRVAAFSLLVLNTLFIAVLIQAMARGLNVNCGCFGAVEQSGSMFLTVGRDLLLLGTLYLVYSNAGNRLDDKSSS